MDALQSNTGFSNGVDTAHLCCLVRSGYSLSPFCALETLATLVTLGHLGTPQFLRSKSLRIQRMALRAIQFQISSAADTTCIQSNKESSRFLLLLGGPMCVLGFLSFCK